MVEQQQRENRAAGCARLNAWSSFRRNVKPNAVISRVRVMPVGEPVSGANVDLNVAADLTSVWSLYDRVFKIWSRAAAGYSRIDDPESITVPINKLYKNRLF